MKRNRVALTLFNLTLELYNPIEWSISSNNFVRLTPTVGNDLMLYHWFYNPSQSSILKIPNFSVKLIFFDIGTLGDSLSLSKKRVVSTFVFGYLVADGLDVYWQNQVKGYHGL